MLYKEFYSELGKLLYAVADVDNAITQQEKNEMKKIVRNLLVPHEKHTDEFGTDAAFYSEIEFDFNDEQIVDSDAAFNSFIDFVSEHHSAFDERMKKSCIHVVEEIASAYHGKNKKEKAIIKVLKGKLKAIEPRKSKNALKATGTDPLFSAEPLLEDFDNDIVEEEHTAYGSLEDIIEERQHGFDKQINKVNRRMAKNMFGHYTIFI